jgi:hypothetical protein
MTKMAGTAETWKHVGPEDDGVQASPGGFVRDFEILVSV